MPNHQRMRIEYMELGVLKRWPKNPKEHDADFMAESFGEFGFVDPILIDEGTGKMVKGHGRLEQLLAMKAAGDPAPERIEVRGGKWYVPVVRGVRFASAKKAGKYVIADNRGVELGGWNNDLLVPQLLSLRDSEDLVGTGFYGSDVVSFLADGDGDGGGASGQLAAKFLVPPFSVLDARQGYWQDRKRAWLALGIRSELGRGAGAANATPGGAMMPATNYSKSGARGDGRGRAVKEPKMAMANDPMQRKRAYDNAS